MPVKKLIAPLLAATMFLASAQASAWLGRHADAPDMPDRLDTRPGEWRSIVVKAKPLVDRESLIAEGKTAPRTGKLVYRGGLVLSSNEEAFGGFSGMRFVPREDGSGLVLLAISDRASWFQADIAFDKNGVPKGLGRARMATMLNHEGKLLENMAGDAESIEVTEIGTLVGFERFHRIDAYARDQKGEYQFLRRILHNRLVRDLDNNNSLEGMARLTDNRLITFAEDPPEAVGGEVTPGWISSAANWKTGGDDWVPIKFETAEDFSVTELAVDDDEKGTGDLFVLERAFSPLAGPRARVSRVKKEDIDAGIVLPAEELGRINIAYGVDNMEAMDLRRLPDGTLLLYILSDDNFSINQRNVMLVFEVLEE